MKKKIPEFKNEKEERNFWQKNDSSLVLDWSKAKVGSFPNLKPTTKMISIRFPQYVLDRIKIKANKHDVPYQSLIKEYVLLTPLLIRTSFISFSLIIPSEL